MLKILMELEQGLPLKISQIIKNTLCHILFLFKPIFLWLNPFSCFIFNFIYLALFKTQEQLKVLNKTEHVIGTNAHWNKILLKNTDTYLYKHTCQWCINKFNKGMIQNKTYKKQVSRNTKCFIRNKKTDHANC